MAKKLEMSYIGFVHYISFGLVVNFFFRRAINWTTVNRDSVIAGPDKTLGTEIIYKITRRRPRIIKGDEIFRLMYIGWALFVVENNGGLIFQFEGPTCAFDLWRVVARLFPINNSPVERRRFF